MLMVLSRAVKDKYFSYRKFPPAGIGESKEEERLMAWAANEIHMKDPQQLKDKHHTLKSLITRMMRAKRSSVTLEMKGEFFGGWPSSVLLFVLVLGKG